MTLHSLRSWSHIAPRSETFDGLFDRLASAAERGYIGENVSQLEHALQAAHFARRAGVSEVEVIAALFHDIGHLDPSADPWGMNGAGVVAHELLGAASLERAGFCEPVCRLVASHVQAKRYLATRSSGYLSRLSSASRTTLDCQGGAMSDTEASQFERDPLFKAMLRIRSFDELTKEVDLEVAPLEYYLPMAKSLVG